jgi:phosphotriesterase-related protein
MAHVQTVRGPVPVEEIGFTLPHEHTSISLWHIEGRWDYWQLTDDAPVIEAELGLFREAGGSCLVDLTLPGVGRDPSRLAALSSRTGLHIVMGCGWYREAHPAEALIDRRSVTTCEPPARRPTGWGTGIRPEHRRDGTDKP